MSELEKYVGKMAARILGPNHVDPEKYQIVVTARGNTSTSYAYAPTLEKAREALAERIASVKRGGYSVKKATIRNQWTGRIVA